MDSFRVKANVQENKLLIQLRGYFMKSELELAFFLALKESKKLTEGFEVELDLDGMHTDKSINNSINKKANDFFMKQGASCVKPVGAIPQMPVFKLIDLEHFSFEGVGFYPN